MTHAPKPRRRWGWGALLLGATLLLALSALYQILATSSDASAYPPPGELVSVGDHRLHIHCTGHGSPTVILEAGMSGWSTDWTLVQLELSRTTRVCAYDRAGYGWSEEGPQPRDSQRIASELHALLSRAGIWGRVVLVGHSLGGLFVQCYARLYPSDVAGLVLVDSVNEVQSQRMKPDVRNRYEGDLRALTTLISVLAPTGLLRLVNQLETIIVSKLPQAQRASTRALGLQSKAYRALAAEMNSFNESQLEVQRAAALPNVPMTVLSSSQVRDFPPGFSRDSIKKVWDELQDDLANRRTNTVRILAKQSGHYIHLDQPELVIGAVVNTVTNVRRSRH